MDLPRQTHPLDSRRVTRFQKTKYPEEVMQNQSLTTFLPIAIAFPTLSDVRINACETSNEHAEAASNNARPSTSE
jgi:hypothetical protein